MKKFKFIIMLMIFMVVLSGCVQAVTNITIEFDTNGGNDIDSVVYNGGSINIPDNPTKEGYIFDGWYWDNETFSNPFTANSIMDQPIEDKLTVYAKWISQDSELTLTLKTIYQLLAENKDKDVIYVERVDSDSQGLQYVQVNQNALNYSVLRGYLKFDNAGIFREIYYADKKIWRLSNYLN